MTGNGEEVGLVRNQLAMRGEKLFTDRRKNTLPVRRKKLPWPQGKPFKILSLDGGGIRGIYGATILRLLEKEVTNGEKIANYFDMIAGTSTGGIMALGLGLEVPATRIENLYCENGKNIFKQRWFWKLFPGLLKFCNHLVAPLYNHNVLEQLLYREFGNRTLGDSVTRLVIPAFKAPKTEIVVFKTDHHPDFKNDWRSRAWEIARATSAAPTFLGGHEYDDAIFLDGGVWANNPIMTAVIDALSAYDITPEQIRVLSIGTGNFPFNITLKNARRGLWRWREVIKAAMFLTTDNAGAQAGLLLGPENIIRLGPSDEAKNIELDDWYKAVRLLPSLATNHFREKKREINWFFLEKVSARERYYSVKSEVMSELAT